MWECLIFKLQDNSSLSSSPSALSSEIQKTPKKRHQIFYAIIAVSVVLVVICATVLLIPLNESSPRELSLNYAVGERMIYENTNILTSQIAEVERSLSDTATYRHDQNSTLIIEVLSENSDSYTVRQTGTMTPDVGITISPLTRSIDKASYYINFVEPQGQFIFHNIDSNPTFLAYLAQDKIAVGDVWTISANVGDASLGRTGEFILKFVGIQEITVPAGTFQTMRIEITSKDLSSHTPDVNMTINSINMQINGTSYVEWGTFRLIKADLTQTEDASKITTYSERTLIEFTKP
ncbi:hypothetical protein [Candidatus Bathycorpusculum sp.]|uniref:hypothetical protein n=1 Tax=Candidatus Bathycorpusculum sp. TaxID=2994959 RepID=UPI00281F0D2F|nr:hypothetical protein [Candidatus Termitimicrobium sp.]MCL2684791.1 hypothetical protein [Candidatus Termitimicrobium sp.]